MLIWLSRQRRILLPQKTEKHSAAETSLEYWLKLSSSVLTRSDLSGKSIPLFIERYVEVCQSPCHIEYLFLSNTCISVSFEHFLVTHRIHFCMDVNTNLSAVSTLNFGKTFVFKLNWFNCIYLLLFLICIIIRFNFLGILAQLSFHDW